VVPVAYLGGDGQEALGAQEQHLFEDKDLGLSIT